MSDAHVGRRSREAGQKMSFSHTTRSDNANASSKLSQRQSRLAPAGPINSANIDCAAVVTARHIPDKSRSPARWPILPNDRHRARRP
jgi:hypothetical protein